MNQSQRDQTTPPEVHSVELARSVVGRFAKADAAQERPKLASWKALVITAWGMFVVIAWVFAMLGML